MGSAIRFNKELGQVQALGVSGAGVRALSREALGLSNTFGIAASDVVNNARAIRARMGDLGEAELLRVTRAATLAGEALGLRNPAEQFAKSMDRIDEAQRILGLSLTDDAGRRLGPTALIERLRERFGDIDTAGETGLIRRAFGDEALPLMTALINNAGILRGSLKDIGDSDLGRRLLETADPFDRWRTSVENLTIVWGSFLLPLVTPWVDAFTAMIQQMQAWAQRFPNLTRLIGLFTVGVLVSALAVALLQVGWGLLGVALVPLRIGLLGITAATWLFNAALWANPITWIVAGILALIAAIILAIVYWAEIKAAALDFWDTAVDQGFIRGFILMWQTIRDAAGAAIDWIMGKWGALLELGSPVLDVLGRVFGAATPEGNQAALATMGLGGEGTGEVVPGGQQAIQTINNGGSSRTIQIGKVDIVNRERMDAQLMERQLAEMALGY
jgi:hypothetical protein